MNWRKLWHKIRGCNGPHVQTEKVNLKNEPVKLSLHWCNTCEYYYHTIHKLPHKEATHVATMLQ